MTVRREPEASEPSRAIAATAPGETVLRRAILVTAVGLSCLLGYFTTYLLQVLLILVAGWFLLRRLSPAADFDTAARLFLVAFLLLAAGELVTLRHPADLLPLLNFATMLLYVPLAMLFRRAAGPSNSRKTADFALAGAAVGLLVSLFFTHVLLEPRAGGNTFFTDPIRLANTALLAGFFAMIGAAAHGGQHRYIYFLGPLMGLVVIFSTGTRTGLIAFAVLLLVAAFMLVRRKLLALSLSLGLALLFGAVAWLGDIAGARAITLFDIAGRLAAGDHPADLGTAIRFILYRAGGQAFLDAPLFGHGWSRLMSSIVPYLDAFEQSHAGLPHLHDDGLNFAVANGMFGLGTYLVMLATPLTACLASPRDSQYHTRLYGCGLLTVSYFVLGLPDTMLSFPLHNTLYVVLTALLLNYCRDARA
ncbi:MAG: O-antigen ligase family protein [Devosia sp.]|nr:O-antigen ligase family protein [Devosia sp.]